MFQHVSTDHMGLKFYECQDKRFEVIEQASDGLFFLYRHNNETGEFDWTETKHTSLASCEDEVNKLMKS